MNASLNTRATLTALGAYTFAGGLISFLGWLLDVPRLTAWNGSGISIQPNTAVAVIACGAALILIGWGKGRAAAVLGFLIAFIGVSALLQYLLGTNFALLNTALMFGRTFGREGVIHPGLMGPPGSVCWTLLGIALVLTAGSKQSRRVASLIALVTFGIAALSMVGHLYGASPLYSIRYLTIIAFQTSTFVAAVSVAILFAIPERPPVVWLADFGTGATGTVARTTLPVIILAPIFLGWIRLLGEASGLYDTRFGTAALVISLITLLLLLLWWSLRTISRNELALRQSERRTVDIIESISDGFVALDRDWHYTFVNDKAAQLMQRSRQELMGKSPWEIFPEATKGTAYKELRRAVSEKVSIDYESYNAHLDLWFASKAYPTDDGGVVVYFQDITERRLIKLQQQAHLSAITRLQAVSTQLVQSGELTVLLREILAAAAELTGTTKGSIQFCERASDALRIVVHQGLDQRFLEQFADDGTPISAAAAKSKSRLIVEDVLEHPPLRNTPDLDVLLASGIRGVQATPLISRDGRLLGMLNNHYEAPHRPDERELGYIDLLARMAADIIERSQTEESLREADKRKDEFLATLAHELRGPLAPMMNSVELLERAGDDAATVNAAHVILRRQLSHMRRLIDDLLDVSRISHGRLDLRFERVDLKTVIESAIESCWPLIRQREHELVIELPPTPVMLHADAARLVQIVSNLLNNAAKFTPQKGRIRIVAVVDASAVEIRVNDSGVGIAREDIPGVFTLFSQIQDAAGVGGGGLGIGLNLVASLVSLHGGTVVAESDGAGNGSTFIVRLPLSGNSSLVSDGNSPQLPELRAPSRRILVVDDNVDSAATLDELLRIDQHQTRIANDGLQAFTTAESFRPDVVLLDIGLPGMSGYETCRRIREQPWGNKVLIIAITGWGQDSDRYKASAAGFDHHLVKPVNYKELTALLG